MPGFDTGSVMYALNVDFTGTSLTAGTAQVTTNGELLIGSTSAPNIKVGTLTSPSGTITIGYSSPNITLDVASGSTITLTGNTGGAISPSAGNINTVGTGSITISGTGSTLTTQLTGLTNHAVLVGAGTATITNIGPTATTGQVLQNNAGADPSYSTATYPSTTTINQILYSSAANVVSGLTTGNNGVLITGTTGIPSLLAAGTTGQVLTATTGSPPSWASPSSSSITFAGDAGTPFSTSSVTIDTGNSARTCGSSVLFTATSPNLNLTVTDSFLSTFIGSLAGNLTHTGVANTSVGHESLKSLTTGLENTAMGYEAGASLSSGSNNTAIGDQALFACTTAGLNVGVGSQALASCNGTSNVGIGFSAGTQITSGMLNTAIGINTINGITTGSYNTCLGNNSGSALNTGDSSNIYIGNLGVGGESNAIRIGTQGSSSNTQNACYVAGIAGISVSNLNYVTINTATGQLGSVAAIPSISNYTNVNHAASPYTVLTTDYYISVDTSAGAVTLNFPNAPTFKQSWIVKDRTGTAATNNITVTTPGGTVTFDGVTSYIMTSNYQAINILANATPTYEIY